MGRTLATFTQLIQREIDAWSRYRRALRREDQAVLDALFAAARRHSAAGAYLARETPFEVMLLSMLIEEHKSIETLRRQLLDLERLLSHHPGDGVAP
jgi:transposase